CALVVGFDAKLRNPVLLLDLKVGKTRDRCEAVAQALREIAQRVEVVAVDFQRDLGAYAGEHVIEAMGDGLANADRGPQDAEPRTDVGKHLLTRGGRGLEIDIDLAEMDALSVLVEFGPSGATADRSNLRNIHQKTLGNQAESIGLAKGDSGVVSEADVERAF